MSGFPIHCKKCRSLIFNTTEFPTQDCHHKNSEGDDQDLTCEDNLLRPMLAPSKCETLDDEKSLFLNDEPYPPFIFDAIENSGWQKGKLQCPKCKTRIGSFNFVNVARCSCSNSILPAINLHSSKIDFVIPPKVSRCSGAEMVPEVNSNPLYDDAPQSASLENGENRAQQMYSESTPEMCDSPTKVSKSEPRQLNIQVSDVTPCNDTNALSRINTSSGSSHHPLNFIETRPLLLRSQTEIFYEENNSSRPMRKRELRRELKRRRSSLPQVSHNNDVSNHASSEMEENLSSNDECCSKSIPDHLICPVCLDLLYSPIAVKPCNHIFCEPCLRRLAKPAPNNTSCPLCRELIGTCNSCQELSKEIKSKYSRQYEERHKFENLHNSQHLPLPWIRQYRLFGYRYGGNAGQGHFGRNWTGWRTIAWIFALDCLGMSIVLLIRWIFENFEEDLKEIRGKQLVLETTPPMASVELEGSSSSYMDSRDLLSSVNESVYSSLVQ